MDDKLYLIDLYNIESADKNFCAFLTSFMQKYSVGIVTDVSGSDIPSEWLQYSKYVFCSDGQELYVNSRLRYKNILNYPREVSDWVRSTELPVTYHAHKLHLSANPYTSASFVRNFNELFTEFRAKSCKNGFVISDTSDPRRHIAALISSNYAITFVSFTALLGGNSYDLAVAISRIGSVYAVDSYKGLQHLLLALI
jgi:hypothetical protein